jgi:hypothetical protein
VISDGAVHTEFRFPYKFLIVVLATSLTVSALFLAVLLGEPTLRFLFGPPAGFHSDFVSREAYNQALLAQSLSVGLAFLMLGAAFGERAESAPWSLALWAANPITVGVGCFLFKLSYQSLHLPVWKFGYYGIPNGVLLCLAAPFVFAPCFRAGAHLNRVKTCNYRR